MKKLLVMVIVMAVVFGMSAGVMAELDTDDVGVDLSIGSYAEVAFENGNYELNFPEPNTNDYFEDERESVFIPFNVKTNDDVQITITEDMTSGLVDMLGESKVWPFAENPPSEAVVAPYFALADADQDLGQVNGTSENDRDDGWTLTVGQDKGTSMGYTVFVENKWLSEDGDWWELLADTYNYTVTATVTAD